MTALPRRIGILGAGALGSLFAYLLTRHTSAEVWLFARSPVPGTISLEGAGRGVSVRVAQRPQGAVDLLIVLVKAYATASALQWASGAVGPQTIGLTLQNGIGNAEALAAALGPKRVLAGTTAQGATLLAPGFVRHAGAGPSYIASWGGADPAPAAALLSQANIAAEVAPHPGPLIWSKLAINCGINALTALLRVPNGELLNRPSARSLMEAAAREAGEVSAAAGVLLPDDPVASTLAVARATAANRSSMLQDLERGRRTEIDAINGAVADYGQRLGVAAPVNQTLADLIRAFA